MSVRHERVLFLQVIVGSHVAPVEVSSLHPIYLLYTFETLVVKTSFFFDAAPHS